MHVYASHIVLIISVAGTVTYKCAFRKLLIQKVKMSYAILQLFVKTKRLERFS